MLQWICEQFKIVLFSFLIKKWFRKGEKNDFKKERFKKRKLNEIWFLVGLPVWLF